MHDCNHVTSIYPRKNFQQNWFGKPQPGNIYTFKDYAKSMRVNFVIYADFESVLLPVDTCEPNSSNSFTLTTHIHKPHSFAYYIKCAHDDSASKFVLYRGEDCAQKFIAYLDNDVRDIYRKFLKDIRPVKPLTPEQQHDYNNATVCFICKTPLNGDKVLDHCHISGNYRGPSHSLCNLNYKIPQFIPVFIHNLSGYDAHLFITELARNGETVDVKTKNTISPPNTYQSIHFQGANGVGNTRFLNYAFSTASAS